MYRWPGFERRTHLAAERQATVTWPQGLLRWIPCAPQTLAHDLFAPAYHLSTLFFYPPVRLPGTLTCEVAPYYPLFLKAEGGEPHSFPSGRDAWRHACNYALERLLFRRHLCHRTCDIKA